MSFIRNSPLKNGREEDVTLVANLVESHEQYNAGSSFVQDPRNETLSFVSSVSKEESIFEFGADVSARDGGKGLLEKGTKKNWKKLARRGDRDEVAEKEVTDPISCAVKRRFADEVGEGNRKRIVLGNVTKSLILAEVADQPHRTQ